MDGWMHGVYTFRVCVCMCVCALDIARFCRRGEKKEEKENTAGCHSGDTEQRRELKGGGMQTERLA